jgi:hypothetical protein
MIGLAVESGRRRCKQRHGFIDDATGRVTGLYLCQNECMLRLLEVLSSDDNQIRCSDGIVHRQSRHFLCKHKEKENWTLEEARAGHSFNKTHFGKITDELEVELIGANSPQADATAAKCRCCVGRVERLWQTRQRANSVGEVGDARQAAGFL